LNFLAYACADLGHRDAEAALRRALAALAAAK
jgi:hypothetical protein